MEQVIQHFFIGLSQIGGQRARRSFSQAVEASKTWGFLECELILPKLKKYRREIK